MPVEGDAQRDPSNQKHHETDERSQCEASAHTINGEIVRKSDRAMADHITMIDPIGVKWVFPFQECKTWEVGEISIGTFHLNELTR